MKMKQELKKIVALMCVVVLVVTSFVIIPKMNVQASDAFDGFENITLSDFGIQDGMVTGTNWFFNSIHELGSGSLDKKVISFKVRFMQAGMLALATSDTVASAPNHNNGILVKQDGTNVLIYSNFDGNWPTMMFPATDIGISSLLTDTISFKIGFEKINNGADVKIIASVNGSEEKSMTITGFGSKMTNKIGVYAGGPGNSFYVESVSEAPIEISPEGLTQIGWSDFGFTQTVEYTAADTPANGVIAHVPSSTISSLVGTSFRGKIAFSMQSDSGYFISYGDYGLNSLGIRIQPKADGRILLQGMDVTVGWPYLTIAELNPATIDLASFTDSTEFELGIDIWEEEGNIKINLFVNGTQYNRTAYIWKNALANNANSATKFLGNNLNFFNINKAENKVKIVVPQPEASPEDLIPLGWEDFGITETSTYTTEDVPAAYAAYGLVPFALDAQKGLSSLIGTSFRGKVAFNPGSADSNCYICYGDNNLNSHGIRIIPQTDGSLLLQAMNIANGWPYPTVAHIKPQDIGLMSFTDGTTFELGIDMWEAADAEDQKNDLKINVFINGVQCTFNAFVIEDGAYNNSVADKRFIGVNVNLFSLQENDKVQIEVVDKEIGLDPEQSPENLIPITWSDFGITEKISYTLEDVAENLISDGFIPRPLDSDKVLSTLVGTSFRGKIAFERGSEESNYYLSYGDFGLNSLGVRIFPQKNGKLLIQAMDLKVGWPYIALATLSPKKANLTSFTDGTEFELGIDMWEETDSEDGINDVKINIFINGVQYNKTSYVWENALANNDDSDTKFLGTNINLISLKEKDKIVIYGEKPDYGTPIHPDSALKEISFSSFGIADGTYQFNNTDLSAKGGYFDPERGKSLNGVLFNGNITFESEWGVQIRLGGKTSAWEGLCFVSNGDGKLLLIDSFQNKTWCVFTPAVAGVQLTDNMLNVKISIEYVDNDGDGKSNDVKVGVWFENVLYKSQFIYLPDCAENMGSMLGIYIPKENIKMAISSENVDNSIDFTLFGYTKNYAAELKRTEKRIEPYLKLSNWRKVK